MNAIKFSMLLIFCFFNVTILQAQSFDAKDMDGMWERNDGVRVQILGTGTFEEGGNAIVFSVGNSNWPASSVNYNFKFRNILHNGDNTWTASNFAYSTGKRTWVADGSVILTMSKDKKEFYASGITYTRKSLIK